MEKELAIIKMVQNIKVSGFMIIIMEREFIPVQLVNNNMDNGYQANYMDQEFMKIKQDVYMKEI